MLCEYTHTHTHTTHTQPFILIGDVHITTWSMNCGMMRWKTHPVLDPGRAASNARGARVQVALRQCCTCDNHKMGKCKASALGFRL